MGFSSCCEESVFTGDPNLAGAAAVLDLPGVLVGGGLGDLLVGGVAEVLAVVFDDPRSIVTLDGKNRAF
jgi:hypothetical protein